MGRFLCEVEQTTSWMRCRIMTAVAPRRPPRYLQSRAEIKSLNPER